MGEQDLSYDAFISYSLQGKVFATLLKKAFENYQPPRGLGLPQRYLKIFLDEEDFTGLLAPHDPSSFKGELLLAISKEIPGADMVRLSGTFMSRVFDGPYNHVPKYMKEMDGYLASLKM